MNFKDIIGPDELDWKVIPLDWKKIGKDELKLGTPMSKDGLEANDASCYGILMDDVEKGKHFQARVIVSGCVDFDKAEAYSGVKVSEEAKKAIRKVWSQAGGGTGPIDPKRLPEGYPYKEGSKTVIEWDGNENGLTEVVFAEGVQSVFKVSDLTPSVAELAENGVMVSTKIFDAGKEDISEDMLTVSDDIVMVASAWFFVVYKAGATLYSTYVFPEPGVYFSKQYSDNDADDNYLTSLTYGTETIHPMAPEFLPALTSPNGTKYQLTVADDGTLSAVAVS